MENQPQVGVYGIDQEWDAGELGDQDQVDVGQPIEQVVNDRIVIFLDQNEAYVERADAAIEFKSCGDKYTYNRQTKGMGPFCELKSGYPLKFILTPKENIAAGHFTVAVGRNHSSEPLETCQLHKKSRRSDSSIHPSSVFGLSGTPNISYQWTTEGNLYYKVPITKNILANTPVTLDIIFPDCLTSCEKGIQKRHRLWKMEIGGRLTASLPIKVLRELRKEKCSKDLASQSQPDLITMTIDQLRECHRVNIIEVAAAQERHVTARRSLKRAREHEEEAYELLDKKNQEAKRICQRIEELQQVLNVPPNGKDGEIPEPNRAFDEPVVSS